MPLKTECVEDNSPHSRVKNLYDSMKSDSDIEDVSEEQNFHPTGCPKKREVKELIKYKLSQRSLDALNESKEDVPRSLLLPLKTARKSSKHKNKTHCSQRPLPDVDF